MIRQQRPDGGFGGRKGGSDLYYTDFALRTLSLASAPDDVLQRAADYLTSVRPKAGDVVECFSWLNARRALGMRIDTAEALSTRTPKTAYEAFIGALCRELAGGILPPAPSLVGKGRTADGILPSLRPDVDGPLIAPNANESRGMPNPQTVALVCALQGEGGGFRGQGGEGEEQANATAAAVAFLTMVDALDPEQAERACRFLASMQAPDGGFLAHAKAPVPDLLSTFTGFVCLAMLDAHSALDLPALGRFVRSCAEATGGFCAGPYDDAPDVEYTYYGVACVALLRAVLEIQR